MIRHFALLALAPWPLLLIGCDTARTSGSPTQPLPAGLIESTRYRNVVLESIIICNNSLSPSVRYHLAPSWDSAAPIHDTIPVFLVHGDELRQGEICFVPDGLRAIVVCADSLDHLREIFAMDCDECSVFDDSTVLALVLLHEVGHIQAGDPGCYWNRGPLVLQGIENEIDKPMNKELLADYFVGQQLRDANLLRPADERFSYTLELSRTAHSVAMNFAQRRFQISSRVLDVMTHQIGVLAGKREFDQSIAEEAANGMSDSRPFYWDRGHTHPNIEFRFLLLSYWTFQTSEMKDGLYSFLQRRSEAEHHIGDIVEVRSADEPRN